MRFSVAVADRHERVTAEVSTRDDRAITVFVRADSKQYEGEPNDRIRQMEDATFAVGRAVVDEIERTFEGKIGVFGVAGERMGLGFGTCLVKLSWNDKGIGGRSVFRAARRGVEEHFQNVELLRSSATTDLLQILAATA